MKTEQKFTKRGKPYSFIKEVEADTSEEEMLLSQVHHNCIIIKKYDKETKKLDFICADCGAERTMSLQNPLRKCPNCGAKIGVKKKRKFILNTNDNWDDLPSKVGKRKIVSQNLERDGIDFVFHEKNGVLSVYRMKARFYEHMDTIISKRTLLEKGSRTEKGEVEGNFFEIVAAASMFRWHKETERSVWLGAGSADAFVEKHNSYFQRIGFPQFVEAFRRECIFSKADTKELLFGYMGLISLYPVFEQLTKSGHGCIAAHALNRESCASRRALEDGVDKVRKLIDLSATSEDKVLKLPKYVCQYLREQQADFWDYEFWIKNWSTFNLSKENFQRFVTSKSFKMLKPYNYDERFVKLVARGYEPTKLGKYLYKQGMRREDITTEEDLLDNMSYLDLSWGLLNYLTTCETEDVIPDPYPQDLQKFRRNMKVFFDNWDLPYDPGIVKQRQGKALELVRKEMTTIPSDYIALFPTEAMEFFNEGNALHMGIGPYIKNVSEGECIVFFVRKRSDPTTPFVAVEFKPHGLGKVVMSYNRPCTDEAVLRFVKKVATIIHLAKSDIF